MHNKSDEMSGGIMGLNVSLVKILMGETCHQIHFSYLRQLFPINIIIATHSNDIPIILLFRLNTQKGAQLLTSILL